jgi:hypothetical protein
MLDLLYKHIFSSNRIFFVLIFFLGGKKKIKWKFRNFHFEKNSVLLSEKFRKNDFLGAGGCFACFSKNGNFEISILFFFPAQKKKLKQKKILFELKICL